MAMSYGDLLAPPPSYADSMMYSHAPPVSSASISAGGPRANSPSYRAPDGMMTTVALSAAGPAAAGVPPPRESSEMAPANGVGATGGEGGPDGNLLVTVSDPQISAGAGSTFGKRVVTYKVRATCDFPEYVVKDATVWRRFRDFVALADHLAHSHRGYFVPPRPEKAPLAAADDAFVRARMASLGAYLRRLVAHPTIRRSAELRVFLTSHDLERDVQWAGFAARVPMPTHGVPTAGMPGAEANENAYGTYGAAPPGALDAGAPGSPGPAPGSRREKVGKFFKELRQTMAQSGAAAAVGGALGLETSKPRVAEDDAVFIAEKDRVLRLEQELAIASQKAERVLLQEEKYGDALGELGLECIKLGKLEDEEANRAGHYTEAGAASRTMATQSRTMGNAVVRISRLTRAATGQLARALDPLHDYLGMMPAVRKAVADRSETLLTLQTLLAEVDGKKARIAKLETDITKMLRVDQLKRELAETQAASEAASREYAHIKERHREEFARLEASRSVTFKDMWLGFARTQVAHAERALSVWRAVAEDLGASPDEWKDTSARAGAGINSPTPGGASPANGGTP